MEQVGGGVVEVRGEIFITKTHFAQVPGQVARLAGSLMGTTGQLTGNWVAEGGKGPTGQLIRSRMTAANVLLGDTVQA